MLDLGLADRMKQPVGLLSGGQRQALTLLMATMVPPLLLLLDEHTAALDPATAEKVLELTKKIVAKNHTTCLMVTHNTVSYTHLGIRFTVRGPGDQIPFIHPSTGERHVLTVLEYQEEEMDRKAFEAPEDMEQEERRRLLRRMGEWEYPTHLTAMTYAVSPDVYKRQAKGECLEKFQLCDKITENFRKNGYDKYSPS